MSIVQENFNIILEVFTMSLENNFFLGYIPDFIKLTSFGFKKKSGYYLFTKLFMDNDFKAEIKVKTDYQLSGKVYDCVTNQEYRELRLKDQKQIYVTKVKEAYLDILSDIKKKAFIKAPFLTPQANRISSLVVKKYKDNPEFLWKSAPHCGVFRHYSNDKWYAIIMNVDRSKIDPSGSGLVEMINLKLDETLIQKLIGTKGFYQAWHMNKKSWISLVLDETLTDSTILKYIDASYINTKPSIKKWIIPANPMFFDLEAAFNKNSEILWKQSSNIQPSDIVYMYVARPYSAIMYKCQVTQTDIPYHFSNEDITINKVMKIKLMNKYDDKLMSFNRLKKLGITAIRGPRSCPQNVCTLLDKKG